MNSNVSLGVIGCGIRTTALVRMAMKAGPFFSLDAACDPLPRQRERFRDEFNPGIALYEDEAAFFAHPGLDWVMVGSWNAHHRRHVEAALRRGLHVFCEKPLATTLEDVADLLALYRASDRRVMIGFTLRYSPHYRRIKSMVDGGAVGRIVSMEFNETLEFNHGGHIMRDWRRRSLNSGGHMLEKCCHDADIANWIVGDLPERVASFGGRNFFRPENQVHMERLGRNDSGAPAYCAHGQTSGLDHPFTGDADVIDNQVAILEYRSGVRATFHTNLNAGIPERRLYILGTEGAIRADVLAGRIESRRIGFDSPLETVDLAGCRGGHGGGDGVLIAYLRKMMVEGAEPLTPIETGAAAAVTCLGVDEAMRQGRIVSLRPWFEKLGLTAEPAAAVPMELQYQS